MFKVGDKIRIKVPSIAADVYSEFVGRVFTIERIDKQMVSGGGRWFRVDSFSISGLHEKDVVMAHGACPMEATCKD